MAIINALPIEHVYLLVYAAAGCAYLGTERPHVFVSDGKWKMDLEMEMGKALARTRRQVSQGRGNTLEATHRARNSFFRQKTFTLLSDHKMFL